jgi:hypothetical protein
MPLRPQMHVRGRKARWYRFRLAGRLVLILLIPVWRVLWHRRRRYWNNPSRTPEFLLFRFQPLGLTKEISFRLEG